MSATVTATATSKVYRIIENGEEMPLTREQIKKVRGLVYYCPECDGYHFWDGKDFEDVESILGIQVSNNSKVVPRVEHTWLGLPLLNQKPE